MECPNWLELPRDITINILQRLSTVDIVTRACFVCPQWWNICKDPFMFRTIHMIDDDISHTDLLKICRHAIERSCGRLQEFDIENFDTDDLLNYIAENGSHLRCLRLAYCSGITDKGLIDAANKLPLLEELDIYFSDITKDSLEVIGRSCPFLKSLNYCFGYSSDNKWYDEAFSFIKTMPQLRHLEICSDMLTNDALLAILDGCPLLESLDMESCDCLDFRGNVWKRCCQQIKNLQRPYEIEDGLFCDDDTYFDNVSENWNDDSNLDSEDDYDDLDDSNLDSEDGYDVLDDS
ncbi:F-box protein skip19 [Trifolium pratense]|uniref:F-box protein skip19 n=1 Tax=Trifolium pratense TaxID=57577 RepID=A0A2K3M1F2_TRIPR|nr:F-box protein skip19 [Trifolium pratense]